MDIVSIIVAAVGSGLVATIITLIVQRVSETRKLKICIFEILMSHRYLIADKENVEALNKVEVIFHKDSEVRKAWTDFLNAADAGATNPMLASTTNDKYLKLLEKIAKKYWIQKYRLGKHKTLLFSTRFSHKNHRRRTFT